jgi:hypothetical protein
VRSSTDKIAQQMRIKMKKMRKENDDFEKSHDNDPSLVKVDHTRAWWQCVVVCVSCVSCVCVVCVVCVS